MTDAVGKVGSDNGEVYGMIAAAKSPTLVAKQLLEKAGPLRCIVSSRGRIVRST
jgi:hypothetical protein